MNKPDHVDIITRQEFLDALTTDMEATLASAKQEAGRMTDEHAHNLAAARMLAQMWHEYATMVTYLVGARSLAETRTVFFEDKKTGRRAFKADRLPWSALFDGPQEQKPKEQEPQEIKQPVVDPRWSQGTEKAYL